jgi:flagellin-specific chaperone FliS
MSAVQIYDQQQSNGYTRIELLLLAYDGTIERIEKAQALIEAGDVNAAQPYLLRAQHLICELMGGLDLQYGEIPNNLRRHYLFVLQATGLDEGEPDLAGAVQVLRKIRDALADVRKEAAELEQRGEIDPLDRAAHNLQQHFA